MAGQGNRNAAGKRVAMERVRVELSLSTKNKLLPLFIEYLSRQNIEPTKGEIADLAGRWALIELKRRLEAELFQDERLSVQVQIAGMYGEEASWVSEVAFGQKEAQATCEKMIARLKAEGCTVLDSRIVREVGLIEDE
jgi:hypothetical protein